MGKGKVVRRGNFSWPRFFIIFLLVFTPLVSGTIYPWSLTFVQFLVALWLLQWWQENKPHRLTKAEKFLLVFFLLAIFSFFATPSRYHFLYEGFKMLSGVTILLLVSHSSLGGDAQRKFAWAIFFTGVIIALYGLYQRGWGFAETFKYLETQRLTLEELGDMRGRLASGRVFSTFVLPSSLAGYLGMVIPLGGALILQTSSWRRWLILAGLLVIILCFFFTYSMGGWLVLSLLVLTGLLIIFLRWKSRKRWLLLIIILLFLVLIGGGLLGKRGWPGGENFGEGAARLRILNWLSTLKIIRDYPFLGKGFGSFALIYPRYKFLQANEVRYAHNWFLQLAAETGILGLGIFMAFLYFLILPNTRRIKKILFQNNWKENGSPWLEVGFFGSLLFFLLHNLLDFDSYIPEIAITWWIIAGLLIFHSHREEVVLGTGEEISKSGKGKLSDVPEEKYGWQNGIGRWVKNIIVMVLILSLIIWSALDYLSQHYFQRGEIFFDVDIDYSISQLELSIKFMPIQASALAYLGSAYNRKAVKKEKENWLSKAIICYQRAVHLEPTVASFHHVLGWLYWRQRNLFSALIEFQKTVENYPTLGKYHTSLGQAYEALGDQAQALQEYEQALSLDPEDMVAGYGASRLRFLKGNKDAGKSH